MKTRSSQPRPDREDQDDRFREARSSDAGQGRPNERAAGETGYGSYSRYVRDGDVYGAFGNDYEEAERWRGEERSGHHGELGPATRDAYRSREDLRPGGRKHYRTEEDDWYGSQESRPRMRGEALPLHRGETGDPYRRGEQYDIREGGAWGGGQGIYGPDEGDSRQLRGTRDRGYDEEHVYPGHISRHGGFPESESGDKKRVPSASGYGPPRHEWNDIPPERRGPKGYVRSDERIREFICERLMHYPHLDVSDVSIEATGGHVTLEGTVPERRMKHMIEDAADACWGVQDVDNRIRVAGRNSPDGQQSRAAAAEEGSRTEQPMPETGQGKGPQGK